MKEKTENVRKKRIFYIDFHNDDRYRRSCFLWTNLLGKKEKQKKEKKMFENWVLKNDKHIKLNFFLKKIRRLYFEVGSSNGKMHLPTMGIQGKKQFFNLESVALLISKEKVNMHSVFIHLSLLKRNMVIKRNSYWFENDCMY